MLKNQIKFIDDHHALIHLVNQPIILSQSQDGKYCWWNMILKLFSQLGPSKLLQNISEALTSIDIRIDLDCFLDQQIARIDLTQTCINKLKTYLHTCNIPTIYIGSWKNNLAKIALPFTLVNGVLFKQGISNKLRQYKYPNKAQFVIQVLQTRIPDGHVCPDLTIKKILQAI